jgi:hypothetical protein
MPEHFTLEDPTLHTTNAIRGLSLGKSIVDVGAEGM